MDMVSVAIAATSFIVTLIIQIFSAGCFVGGLVFAIKYIEKQIKRLEEKQDKHNGVIERTALCEASTKSAHLRVDEIMERVERLEEKI